MRFASRFVFAKTLFLGLFALGISPAAAHAQEASGKFTLPSTTHWGQSVLAAGDYSYSVDNVGPGALVLVRRSDGKDGFLVVANSYSASIAPESDHIAMENRDGELFVSSLALRSVGILNFVIPRNSEHKPGLEPIAKLGQ